MILDFFLKLISFLLVRIAEQLPTYTIFPTNLSANITTFMSALYGWSWLFPVSQLLGFVLILVLLCFAEFTYFVVMFILSIIHATIRG